MLALNEAHFNALRCTSLWCAPRPPSAVQVDLPPLLGVDLVHCEREAGAAVSATAGAMRLLQGELVTDAYFDSVADEIDETLQVRRRRLDGVTSQRV